MFYSVSYNSIACISAGYKQNDYSGSSSYTVENQRLIRKPKRTQPLTSGLVQCGHKSNASDSALLNVSSSQSDCTANSALAPSRQPLGVMQATFERKRNY